jgi:hypothetical protein
MGYHARIRRKHINKWTLVCSCAHIYIYNEKKKSQERKKEKGAEQHTVQSTSSYPSFSVYIHKEAWKTAAGNDDGCAPDNMVITPSITNDTFFSLSLSRFLLPISYTMKTKKKENNSKRMACEICTLLLPKTSYTYIEVSFLRNE